MTKTLQQRFYHEHLWNTHNEVDMFHCQFNFDMTNSEEEFPLVASVHALDKCAQFVSSDKKSFKLS